MVNILRATFFSMRWITQLILFFTLFLLLTLATTLLRMTVIIAGQLIQFLILKLVDAWNMLKTMLRLDFSNAFIELNHAFQATIKGVIALSILIPIICFITLRQTLKEVYQTYNLWHCNVVSISSLLTELVRLNYKDILSVILNPSNDFEDTFNVFVEPNNEFYVVNQLAKNIEEIEHKNLFDRLLLPNTVIVIKDESLTDVEIQALEKITSLANALEQYRDIKNRLTEDICPITLIPSKELEEPILLLKQYRDGNQWLPVPAMANLFDKSSLKECILRSNKHPINRENLSTPPYYKNDKHNWISYDTRYICHAFTGASQEINLMAKKLRSHLQPSISPWAKEAPSARLFKPCSSTPTNSQLLSEPQTIREWKSLI